MRKSQFSKFNNFILYPDIANKFLIDNVSKIPKIKEKQIYLMYIFRQKSPFSFMGIKALIMINSIHLQEGKTKTKLIILKYSKTQSHSKVYLSLTFTDFINIFSIFYKKPTSLKKTINSFVSEKKHFVFPGYVNHLRIPSWKKSLNLSFSKKNYDKYWLYFYKTAFID